MTGDEISNGNAKQQEAKPEPVQVKPQAFCVILPSGGGKPFKISGATPGDFIPSLKDASLAWINFPVENVKTDSDYIAASFGFSQSLTQTLVSARYSAYEDLDTELGMRMPAVRIEKMNVRVRPLLIFVRKGLILTIHSKDVERFIRMGRYAEAVMRKIKQSATGVDKLTILLERILDETNIRNFDGLRLIEEEGDVLSRSLLDPTTPRARLGPEIYKMKHALIMYLNTLWATLDVLNSLRYGDAEVITDDPKILTRLNLLVEEVNQHISLAEHMSEVLASGLEVLQSIYNNQLQVLNNRMAKITAWMTVLGTALLVPNTIATILGGFGLTIWDVWWYIPLLFGSTSIATYLAYYIVKSRGLVPKTVD
jgi:magnesium transporter